MVFLIIWRSNCLELWIKLHEQGYLENIKILGSSLQTVVDAEDRERFKNILEEIGEYTAPSRNSIKY